MDTLYPFGSTLNYEVTASAPISFGVRVPEWAKTGKSTIKIGNAKASAVKPNADSIHVVKVCIQLCPFWSVVHLVTPCTVACQG